MRYITVSNLSFYYDREPVLEGINYYLDSGEFVTLTGENGAAKSTLIKASLGILQPKVGTVEISKTNVKGKKLRIAYLPQQIASFNAGFPSTVYEFVKSGRYPRKGWFRKLNEHDETHILEEFRICWDAGVQGSGDWFFVWWSETAGRHCSDVCFRSGYLCFR